MNKTPNIWLLKAHKMKRNINRRYGKYNPMYMHSSLPLVHLQTQTLNRVLKLCTKRSNSEMQTHSNTYSTLWKRMMMMKTIMLMMVMINENQPCWWIVEQNTVIHSSRVSKLKWNIDHAVVNSVRAMMILLLMMLMK